MQREVSTYEYTRLTDIRIAKKLILDNYGSEPVVLEDEHIGNCCEWEPKLVQTLNFGRYRGIEMCSKCVDNERRFIQSLIDHDETIELIVKDNDAVVTLRKQNEAFEKIKKEALTRDQIKRKELEESGQQRLF